MQGGPILGLSGRGLQAGNFSVTLEKPRPSDAQCQSSSLTVATLYLAINV